MTFRTDIYGAMRISIEPETSDIPITLSCTLFIANEH